MPAESPSLREVQERFYDLVTAPEGVAQRLIEQGRAAAHVEAIVRGDQRLSATERVDLYANMYFFRILDVLRDDYPKVLAVLGDAAFHNVVSDYLVACRPAHPSLRNVGERLPAYLAGHAVVTRRPWLADLARLERERIEVFDGADAEVLSLDALRAVPPDSLAALAIRTIPSCVAFDVAFAVEELWQAPEERRPLEEPARSPGRVLVWRQEPMVYQRRMEVVEVEVWPLLQEGAPIGKICEHLAETTSSEEVVALAFRLLGSWASDGLLVAL